MNILVVGNGFDLAHGLPTKYSDFLDFVNVINAIYKLPNYTQNIIEVDCIISNEGSKLDEHIKFLLHYKFLELICSNVEDCEYYLFAWELLINGNLWLKYFYDNIDFIGENWIDFEKEISIFIRSIEPFMRKSDVSIKSISDYIYKSFNEKRNIDNVLKPFMLNDGIDFQYLKLSLEKDLDRLILALETYLYEYVEKIKINEKQQNIIDVKINKVISFNYTNTSEIYKEGDDFDIDYIHGKAKTAQLLGCCSNNDMVLGIDEYLNVKDRDNNIEFVKFKKYYQIIEKGINYKFRSWFDEFNKVNISNVKKGNKHNLYIFGHSLDITDKDILRELILRDDVVTTIFYHRDEVKRKLIENLQKIIGQEELIRRTKYPCNSIKFERQR